MAKTKIEQLAEFLGSFYGNLKINQADVIANQGTVLFFAQIATPALRASVTQSTVDAFPFLHLTSQYKAVVAENKSLTEQNAKLTALVEELKVKAATEETASAVESTTASTESTVNA
jgi:hypothetical protein